MSMEYEGRNWKIEFGGSLREVTIHVQLIQETNDVHPLQANNGRDHNDRSGWKAVSLRWVIQTVCVPASGDRNLPDAH